MIIGIFHELDSPILRLVMKTPSTPAIESLVSMFVGKATDFVADALSCMNEYEMKGTNSDRN
jgi:hypothetical protein